MWIIRAGARRRSAALASRFMRSAGPRSCSMDTATRLLRCIPAWTCANTTEANGRGERGRAKHETIDTDSFEDADVDRLSGSDGTGDVPDHPEYGSRSDGKPRADNRVQHAVASHPFAGGDAVAESVTAAELAYQVSPAFGPFCVLLRHSAHADVCCALLGFQCARHDRRY